MHTYTYVLHYVSAYTFSQSLIPHICHSYTYLPPPYLSHQPLVPSPLLTSSRMKVIVI